MQALSTAMPPAQFQQAVLDWFDHHGRKDLPWQHHINPYRVWISEIMLQQTQVVTVIPYFEKFITRFPTITELAHADEDQVLHLWTGLGYYTRARNLHKTAKVIHEEHGGSFPDNIEALQELPGIGRSTAGAIAAISMNKPAAILDGNVKRVLTRFLAIEGWPGKSDILKKLWLVAEHYTPDTRVADYTQVMMDLGATVCNRSTPRCDQCPLQSHCQAHQLGTEKTFPTSKPKKILPVKATSMMMVQNSQQEVLLYKRPAQGIWGGLWSFPETDSENSDNWCEDNLLITPEHRDSWQPVRHTFSHYHLDISPVHIRLDKMPTIVQESAQWAWYNPNNLDKIGLAAPVKKLLLKLF